MAYFPMCIDLTDKTVLLVGSGPQTDQKAEKLRPFGCRILRLPSLTAEDLTGQPALVVIGDVADASEYAALCRRRGVPVNVVDQPALCSFTFPALITEGDLTVSVSTGGKSPALAACLAGYIRETLPQRCGEILQWLSALRASLPFPLRRKAAEAALSRNRPLTDEELSQLK